MYTSKHGGTVKKAERSMLNVQEAVSEEVMLPSTMPVSPSGMFCFSQLCTRVTETHMLWMSAQDMTFFYPRQQHLSSKSMTMALESVWLFHFSMWFWFYRWTVRPCTGQQEPAVSRQCVCCWTTTWRWMIWTAYVSYAFCLSATKLCE